MFIYKSETERLFGGERANVSRSLPIQSPQYVFSSILAQYNYLTWRSKRHTVMAGPSKASVNVEDFVHCSCFCSNMSSIVPKRASSVKQSLQCNRNRSSSTRRNFLVDPESIQCASYEVSMTDLSLLYAYMPLVSLMVLNISWNQSNRRVDNSFQ